MSLQQLIYNHCPVILQNTLISIYGARLKYLRYGKVFRSEYDELKHSIHQTTDYLTALQEASLSDLLNHANNYVPYYQSVFQERGIDPGDVCIRNLPNVLPVVKKVDIKNTPERFVSSYFKNNQLTKIHTSGTTGAPLVVYATKDSVQKNYAFFLRFLNMAGFATGQPSATFAGRIIIPPAQNRPPYWRSNKAMNNVLFSSYHISDSTIPAYLQELERIKITLIDSYPSAIYTIAKFINRNSIKHTIRPRAIITSSETLLDYQRESIETAFKCKVFDQYGSAEMVAFISQCSRGSYHINSEYGIVEVLGDDDQPVGFGVPGRLVCTGFLNYAMPLIRYDTGDTAILSEKKCGCGLNFPVIESILGRKDDLLITPSGKMVGRLDPVFKGLSHIKETQIIQESINKIRVNIVRESGFTTDISETLKKELNRRMGDDVEISIIYVDSIPRTKSGKFRSVISEI